MAINFPTGTQGYPGVAHRFFYDEDVAHRAMSIGDGWYTVPGISLNIACRSTSNRLLFLPSVSWSVSTSNMEIGFAIHAGGTKIGYGTGATVGSNALDLAAFGVGDTSNETHGGWKMFQWQQSLVYHPNTTSNVTYDIRVRGRSGGTLNVNRLHSMSSLEGFTGHSSLLALELEF